MQKKRELGEEAGFVERLVHLHRFRGIGSELHWLTFLDLDSETLVLGQLEQMVDGFLALWIQQVVGVNPRRSGVVTTS